MNAAPTEFVTLRQTNEIVARAEFVTRGQANKENATSVVHKTPAYVEVQKFLSIPEASSFVEKVHALRKAADQFYQELGVNPALSTYGQLGIYQPIYKSYKHQGFIYRLDSLRRFGLRNIELKDGEWHPERHFLYPEVYEVTYP